jgi:hypothetical protein
MRIRIIQKPSLACVDGVRLDYFEAGNQYEVGSLIGAFMVAERWAEPVAPDVAAFGSRLDEFAPERDRSRSSRAQATRSTH